MQQRIQPGTIAPKDLRDAMQDVPKPRAVVHAEADRIVIEFSDGRVHYVEHARNLATDQLIVAAVHWCKRHGADVVEISS